MSAQGEISGTGQRGYYREARAQVRHIMDFYIEPRWAVNLFPRRRGHALFTRNPISRVYFLSDSPQHAVRGCALLAGNIKAEGGKMDYCWLVFDKAHAGPPTVHWLRRRK